MYKIYKEDLINELKSVIENWYKEINFKKQDKKVYKMIISKEVEDRDNETIILDWLDDKWYKKNPVVLIDHSYKIEDIVWKTIKLYKEWKTLYADFIFANTEKAKIIEQMYEEWFINASSIWFLVKQREEWDWKKINFSELLEWSLVVAWSNREALREKNIELYEKAEKSWLLKEIKTLDTKQEVEQEEIKEEVNELDEIKKELAEIKTILKSLADDKAEEKTLKQEIADEEADIKAKKETLQAINKGLSDTLAKIKLL